ncbi:TetR/AcrR family transcriptional regulator [Paracoccus aminophilus]|uniref:Transcriptional regulator, TetR family n=1 Tax=Paracoccus aminophilus JCM 7686 TaxID=1367847 RepID=S5XZB2_PARAH|nr:TetR/AcrR family transcriptional regulator [Paracoccus aminophilus]AGT08795.1 transcriptional regulator, TetR family [Paracoccus aminophilus JCM 7686]
MSTEKRPRGRPKDPGKRAALLDAGRRLLLAKGVEISTDEIAAAAGVSKSTLYALFQDKESLIEEIIRREAERIVADDEFSGLLGRRVSPDSLVEFGIRYLNFVNNREILSWERALSSLEASRPDLPRHFFDLGPGRGQRLLGELLAKAMTEGLIATVSPQEAADQLIGLWLGFAHLEVRLGARPPFSDDEIAARVRRGTGLFLKACGEAAPPPR